jgi:aminomethyltransferase
MAQARSPLHELERLAGARFVPRGGWEVAGSYGPVAAEIAACRGSAGIADLSHIEKLELRAPEPALAAFLAEHAGAAPEVGRARLAAGIWWCRPEADRALAVAAHASEGIPRGDAGAEDVTAALAAIVLAGPRSAEVLALVVPEADTLPEAGVRTSVAAGAPATIVRERADRFLLLCAAADAERLWLALSDAGRPLRAAHVGVDALERLDAVPVATAAAR